MCLEVHLRVYYVWGEGGGEGRLEHTKARGVKCFRRVGEKWFLDSQVFFSPTLSLSRGFSCSLGYVYKSLYPYRERL